MGERGAAHGEVAVLEQQRALFCRCFDPMHLQGIADPGGAGSQHPVEVTLERVGAVQINPRGAAAGQSEACQEPRKAEDMVAMHVGDEHPAQL